MQRVQALIWIFRHKVSFGLSGAAFLLCWRVFSFLSLKKKVFFRKERNYTMWNIFMLFLLTDSKTGCVWEGKYLAENSDAPFNREKDPAAVHSKKSSKWVSKLVGKDVSAEDVKPLPELVSIHGLSEVPEDRDWMLLEMQRLSDFFAPEAEKYVLYAELRKALVTWEVPVLWHWLAVGAAVAALLCALLGQVLSMPVCLFLVVACMAVAVIGYVRASRKSRRLRANLQRKLRHAENILRRIYNSAEDCFLPIGYTAPDALLGILSDLESRKTNSLEEAMQWNQDKVETFS